MFKIAGGHFCLVHGTFGAYNCFKVFYQTLMDGQNLFNVAEERLNVACCECALMRISLLLSGFLKNMLCVLLCGCI